MLYVRSWFQAVFIAQVNHCQEYAGGFCTLLAFAKQEVFAVDRGNLCLTKRGCDQKQPIMPIFNGGFDALIPFVAATVAGNKAESVSKFSEKAH